MTSVLFVCLGNICRSSAAEGILRHLAAKDHRLKDLVVKSCGLGDWHLGKLPDQHMQEALQKRGIYLFSRAQQFKPEFLDRFDYILSADHSVLNALYEFTKDPAQKAKIHLITHFSKSYPNEEVPDPYYGGDDSFEHVLNILEDSCENLIEHILQENSKDAPNDN